MNTYDEYGIPGTGNTGRFQYTGQAWLAELGMYYYKARIYSPTLGRFLQTDPIGYKDQVNLYAYAGNDPVDGSDPSGMCTGSLIEGQDGACKGAGLVNPGLNGPGTSDGAVPGKGNGAGQGTSGLGQDANQQNLPQNGNDDIVVTARHQAVASQFPNTIIFATYFDGQYIGDRRVLWKYRDHAAERVLSYLAGDHVENKILNQLTNQGAATVAPGTLMRGFFNDDIVAWQWRAMVLPGGDISVGTVHLTWPSP